MNDAKQVIKEMITDIEKRIVRIEKNIAPYGMICGCNWIIRIDKVHITPEFDYHKKTTGIVKNGDPDMVMRFTEEDAKNLAPKAKNGRGDRGEAIFWIDACNELLVDLKSQLEDFKAVTL